jgi:hypothetical protein
MTTKLTDAQHLMLNAAAQRDDRILAMPPNLRAPRRPRLQPS